MKPITFKGVNVLYGRNQQEYIPLPTFKSPDGIVVSCWKLGIYERIKVLFTGRIWVQQMTFDAKLQPQKVGVDNPFESLGNKICLKQ